MENEKMEPKREPKSIKNRENRYKNEVRKIKEKKINNPSKIALPRGLPLSNLQGRNFRRKPTKGRKPSKKGNLLEGNPLSADPNTPEGGGVPPARSGFFRFWEDFGGG